MSDGVVKFSWNEVDECTMSDVSYIINITSLGNATNNQTQIITQSDSELLPFTPGQSYNATIVAVFSDTASSPERTSESTQCTFTAQQTGACNANGLI